MLPGVPTLFLLSCCTVLWGTISTYIDSYGDVTTSALGHENNDKIQSTTRQATSIREVEVETTQI